MKRKIILIYVLLVISLVVIGKYKNIKHEKTIHNLKESNIAIMVYDDESESYVKQTSVPKGAKYSLNEALTKCEAGGKVTDYSKVHGTLKYELNRADYCYVYFDVDNTPSYAIYSETDNSLIFYKNNDTVGNEYNGKVVTAKYDDIEETAYTFSGSGEATVPNTPWYEYASVIKRVSVANKVLPLSTANWFCMLTQLESIDLTNLDTGYVTSMERMFDRAGMNSSTLNLILGDDFNTSNTIDMSYMFQGTGYIDTNFTLDLGSKFNTSNVVDMKYLFASCGKSSLVFTLNLGDKFDTSKVTNMRQMFESVGRANENFILDLGSKFNTSNVTNMYYMFNQTGYSSTIFELKLGDKFDTSNVTTMMAMFQYNGKNNLDFELNFGDKFDTSKVTSMSRMFNETGKSNSNFILDVSDFVVSSSCALSMFAQYSSQKIIFGEGWSNANLVSGMFKCDSSTPLEVVNAPANILNYDFANDNRVVTFTTI